MNPTSANYSMILTDLPSRGKMKADIPFLQLFDPADDMAQDSTVAAIHCHQLQNFISVKYLGVTIPRDLGCDLHIADVTRRASRTLGFVRRNLRLFSRKTKEAAYKALDRVHQSCMEPLHSALLGRDAIDKIQRHAARWATLCYKPTPMLEESWTGHHSGQARKGQAHHARA